jgi:thioredoxin 1
MKEFTDDNFEKEALSSDKPVVVDLWAPWCGPCKRLTPVIEELAAEYGDTVKIGKLNVDDNQQTAAKYSVTSIPTILFIKNGQIAEKHIGLLAKENLKKKIDALIKP